MSGKEFGPGETPPSYGYEHPAGEGNPYPPSGQPYPNAPPGYSAQPGPGYQQPPAGGYYAPQYAPTTTGYSTHTVVPGHMMATSEPPDHFCLAVFVTLCCFWPTGILAIMKASDARSSAARGDMITANSQARSAKQMINVSIGIGIASFVLVGIIVGVYVGVVLNAINY